VRAEAVSGQIRVFGWMLDDATLQALPASSRANARAGDAYDMAMAAGWRDRRILKKFWGTYVTSNDEAALAVDRPTRAERHRELDASRRRLESSLDPATPAVRTWLSDWTKYVDSHDHALALLDLLAVAATVDLHRLEHGAWPSAAALPTSLSAPPVTIVPLAASATIAIAEPKARDDLSDLVVTMHAE
jgi:hypothetical protein